MTKEIWFAKHDDGKYRNPDNWTPPDHEKHSYSSAAPVVDSSGKLVAYVCGATSSGKGFDEIDEIIEPRARLISAAPELLEALKGLDEAYCRAGSPLTKEERQEDRMRLIKARAAIAKATGEKV